MTIGQWFSFGGRIGRRTFWLAYMLPLFVVGVVANVLDVALGLTPPPTADAVPADAAQVGPISGVVGLLTLWPMLAATVKRLHDRDRSGWWIGGFYLTCAALGVVWFISVARVVAGIYADRGQTVVPELAPSVLIALVVGGLVVLGLGLWLFIETGFLRGTMGPNRFGPDPLGGATPHWQPGVPPQGWHPQGPPPGWQPPQWQPPPQGWPPPPQGWPPPGQAGPPPGYGQPPPGYGQPPPGHGQPPPGYGQPPPGYGQPPAPPQGPWTGPGRGGSVPPVRRD